MRVKIKLCQPFLEWLAFFLQNEKPNSMNATVSLVLRILLGLFLLVFGIDKFFHFLSLPPIPGDGGILMDIYAKSGFLYIIGLLEVLAGIALLVNKFVPLALIFSIAIFFNAAFIHLIYDPLNVIGALVGLVISFALVFGNRERFSGILSA